MSVPVRNSVAGGFRVNSERQGRLTDGQHDLIESMLDLGSSIVDIALAVGCSSKTVQRAKNERARYNA